MNKLESKVFFVLTLILSLFLITILIIFNAQSYAREKSNIQNNLMRMSNQFRKTDNRINPPEINDNRNNSDIGQKIFMDSVIYTITIDEYGNIEEIISHTENGDIEDEIKSFAKEIINNPNKKYLMIGNLYFEKYSYSFKGNDTLTIVDNSMAQARLRNEVKSSIIILFILEVIIILTSKKLTNWITKPAIEALDKQKQFIADASHELKTPIAVILASSEALEDDFQQKWIDNIKSESERMNKLITNLLNLSKIENAVEKEMYVVTNISKAIDNSCLTFESLMYEKQIKFTANIEENISLKCDIYQIKQLVAILVDNSIKHCEQNGEIIVNLKNQKNEIVLEVKNQGKAIPDEMKEKIFERFYRVDESRNRNDDRYGLGLAIAKSIVINHEGKITVNSTNGYTTFKVNFKKVQK
ncbi:MAG: GHKL domain-containing protein [Clostridia bacterium]|nr:GHKL domain-containing protein [Clostridia bacterium]